MMCPGCLMGAGTLLVWMLLLLAVVAGATASRLNSGLERPWLNPGDPPTR